MHWNLKSMLGMGRIPWSELWQHDCNTLNVQRKKNLLPEESCGTLEGIAWLGDLAASAAHVTVGLGVSPCAASLEFNNRASARVTVGLGPRPLASLEFKLVA